TIDANTVTGNGSTSQDPGVTITNGTGNLIQQNRIDGNAGRGITLVGAGNGQQPAPALASATTSGGNDLHVTGPDTAGTANKDYALEFFSSPLADPTGFGEGAIYIGAATMHTDAGGAGAFDASLTATAAAVPIGSYISATATEATNGTSAFSNDQVATG